MLASTFIATLRRKYDDVPKAAQVIRQADGVATLFNVGRNRVPIIENSYSVYFGTSAKTETTDFSLDKDSGDLTTVAIVSNGINVKTTFKHANFRDAHWVEAINYGIDALNGRGFYIQSVRDTSSMRISANVRVYDGPSNAFDLYEVLQSDDYTVSGNFKKLGNNWSYQADVNKLVLGYKPSVANRLAVSYLRTLQKYTATSATLDVRDPWLSLLDLKAGEYYFRHMASRTATQGNASIQEGHFSYTSLRTQANDLANMFEIEAKRMKPTRPAKDIQFNIPTSDSA